METKIQPCFNLRLLLATLSYNNVMCSMYSDSFYSKVDKGVENVY